MSLKKYSILVLVYLVGIPAWAQPSESPIETVIQRGHRATIRSVVYSPDGNLIATASRDNSIKLWETATGREIRSFQGHQKPVNTIRFDASGNRIASGSSDNSIIVWEVTTGKILNHLIGHQQRVTSVAFSPDGVYLASGGWDRQVYTWDLSTGDQTGEYTVNPARGTGEGVTVLFAKDGKQLITGNDDGKIIIYDIATKNAVDTLRNINPSSCGGCPTFVELSENGKELLSASDKGAVSLWDLKAGKLIKTYGNENDNSTSVGMQGGYSYLSTEDSVKVWNRSGRLVRSFVTNEANILSAVLSPGGEHIAIASGNTVEIYEVVSGKSEMVLAGILNEQEGNLLGLDPESYRQYDISRYVNFREYIKVSPDEKYIAKAVGNAIILWDLEKGRVIRSFGDHQKGITAFEFSPDGKWLLTGGGDGLIRIWETATGSLYKSLKGHREMIFDLAFSQNQKYLLSGGWDAKVMLWDIESGNLVRSYTMDNNSPYTLSFAHNDLYFIIGGLGKDLKMIEIDTGIAVRSLIGHTEIVADISTSNGQLLTASWDGTTKIWDINTGLIAQKLRGHSGHVYSATWSQSGSWIATAGADRVVILWDANTGAKIKTFKGHTDAVLSVEFLHQDKHLISHSLDGTTKIWDVNSGDELISHILLNDGEWLVKNPDGFFDSTEKAKQNIFFVKGIKSYAIDQFFEDFYRPGILSETLNGMGYINLNIDINQKLDNSPPPTIEVISPAVGEHLTRSEIDVVLKITNKGGGVSEVKLLHNGKRLVGHDRSFFEKVKSGKSVYHHFPVKLLPGKNILSFSAFSDERIESEMIHREILVDGIREDITCHVMAIGIDEYQNPALNLNYAFEDAEAFLKLVKSKGKNLFNDTKVYPLFNKKATKANILATLDEISAVANPQDVFFFYYAGHGSIVDGNFFFIPTESKRLYDIELLNNEAINAMEIQEKFAKISALKQLVVMDACQSGGAVELLSRRGATEEKAMAQLSRSSGVHVLAASGSEQFATEFEVLGHGLFTYVLLEALSGKADGAPKDGKVTIYELKAYLDARVPEYSNTYKGSPQYPVTFSKGQDFPIVLE